MMEERWRALCRVDEIPEPGSRGFALDCPGGPLEMFLVRKQGRIYAYLNSCPHTGATLEWLPDRFLDAEEQLIQCGLHGALFLIETGECLRGPCLGDFLTAFPVIVREGQVLFGVGSVRQGQPEA
jgi:nitrite reductase/ring-hydroxylating ferredoxin subunit